MLVSLSPLLRPSANYMQLCRNSSLTVVEKLDNRLDISLASPKTRNALSLDMMNTIISNLSDAAKDASVRSIVLRANGDGHVFSAGHNLKEMTAEAGRAHHRLIFETCERLMQLIGRIPVPVIAAVDGLAAAAGCQLVASADIAVATTRSRFSTPGASVGLFCHTPGIPLARRVPRAVSGYMLLTGEPISSKEALRAGLISKLVDPSELESEIGRIHAAIASKPREVIALGKRFYRHQLELSLDAAYQAGTEVMVENLGFEDAQEGIAAFKEKRKPVFTHTDKLRE